METDPINYLPKEENHLHTLAENVVSHIQHITFPKSIYVRTPNKLIL